MIRVEVARVDVDRRELDFRIVKKIGHAGGHTNPKRQRGSGGERGDRGQGTGDRGTQTEDNRSRSANDKGPAKSQGRRKSRPGKSERQGRNRP